MMVVEQRQHNALPIRLELIGMTSQVSAPKHTDLFRNVPCMGIRTQPYTVQYTCISYCIICTGHIDLNLKKGHSSKSRELVLFTLSALYAVLQWPVRLVHITRCMHA